MTVERDDWLALIATMPPSLRQALTDAPWEMDLLRQLKLPVELVPIAELRWLLDLPVWRDGKERFRLSPAQVRGNPQRYSEQWSRTLAADLLDPIHLVLHRGRWSLLDGFHRLLRADTLGHETIPAMKLADADLARICRIER